MVLGQWRFLFPLPTFCTECNNKSFSVLKKKQSFRTRDLRVIAGSGERENNIQLLSSLYTVYTQCHHSVYNYLHLLDKEKKNQGLWRKSRSMDIPKSHLQCIRKERGENMFRTWSITCFYYQISSDSDQISRPKYTVLDKCILWQTKRSHNLPSKEQLEIFK